MTQSAASTLRNAKRRGGFPSGRLRFSARPGVTLVELLVAMLILTIVCISWLQIIGIQSAKREARRREAVERLSGIMDAFLYCYKHGGVSPGSYCFVLNPGDSLTFKRDTDSSVVHPMFEDSVSPVGYQLRVVQNRSNELDARLFDGWKPVGRNIMGYWLIGSLYDGNGAVGDLGRPYFTLPVYSGL